MKLSDFLKAKFPDAKFQNTKFCIVKIVACIVEFQDEGLGHTILTFWKMT